MDADIKGKQKLETSRKGKKIQAVVNSDHQSLSLAPVSLIRYLFPATETNLVC